MKIETHRFRLSEFDCLIVNDGKFVMDAFPPEIVLAGASEEEIRQALQQHDSDPAQWRVGFNFSCLVINTGDRLVLVDTGCGATDFMPDVGHLPEGLAAEGLAPADIDTVILTHGHWDHVAGLVDLNGKLVFPDAEFVMWREEWEFWNDKANAALLYQNYNDQDKVPFATVPLIKDRVRLIEAESEILPGIEAVAAPGHSVAHIALAITSGDEPAATYC
jgi:glyoxylase-like metal-dependent hydrolase (beta-lactamase superfamily II)